MKGTKPFRLVILTEVFQQLSNLSGMDVVKVNDQVPEGPCTHDAKHGEVARALRHFRDRRAELRDGAKMQACTYRIERQVHAPETDPVKRSCHDGVLSGQ
jgi:hypothetical protein